jgi:hypothetical protein
MKPAIEADLMLLDKVANPYMKHMQPLLEHFTAGIFARTTPRWLFHPDEPHFTRSGCFIATVNVV